MLTVTTFNMVDTSGSSHCSTSSSTGSRESGRTKSETLHTNDLSGRAYAKKKIRRQRDRRDTNDDMIDDFDLQNSTDKSNGVALADHDDQKIPSILSCTTIGPYDVICGRNKMAFNNIGNRRFRFTIALALPRFLSTKSRKEKSIVIQSIQQLVHQNGGRFLMTLNDDEEEEEAAEEEEEADVDVSCNDKNSTMWTELNTKQSHLKVGHALRDAERKLSKARELQQQKLRQKEEKRRRNNDTFHRPIHATMEGNTLLDVTTGSCTDMADPLLLIHQNGTWDLNECDAASISTISYMDGGDVLASEVHHPLLHIPVQQSLPSNFVKDVTTEEELPPTTVQIELPSLRSHTNHLGNSYWHRQGQLLDSQQCPMQIPTPLLNVSRIVDGRQQLLQPTVPFNPNTSMAINNDNSNIQNPWTDNRRRTNGTVPLQPGQQLSSMFNDTGRVMVDNMNSDHDHPYYHTSTSLLHPVQPNTLSEFDQYLQNMNDDHHQHMMTWLVDESEDVMDEFINSLGV